MRRGEAAKRAASKRQAQAQAACALGAGDRERFLAAGVVAVPADRCPRAGQRVVTGLTTRAALAAALLRVSVPGRARTRDPGADASSLARRWRWRALRLSGCSLEPRCRERTVRRTKNSAEQRTRVRLRFLDLGCWRSFVS